MWQRFTEMTRRIIFFSQEEAARCGESYVGTEHLLLGILREKECVAFRLIVEMEINPVQLRTAVEQNLARSSGQLGQEMQLTPRAKRVVDLAYEESKQLDCNYVGTEHVLLGLIREADSIAGRLLSKSGATLITARAIAKDIESNCTAYQLPAPISSTKEISMVVTLSDSDTTAVVLHALHTLWPHRNELLKSEDNGKLESHPFWPLLRAWIKKASRPTLNELGAGHLKTSDPEQLAIELRQLAAEENENLVRNFLLLHPLAIKALVQAGHPENVWPHLLEIFDLLTHPRDSQELPEEQELALLTAFMGGNHWIYAKILKDVGVDSAKTQFEVLCNAVRDHLSSAEKLRSIVGRPKV